MDLTIAFNLIPYLISLAISLGVTLEAWQRQTPSARSYAGVAGSQAFWTAGYIFELLAPSIEGKTFWDNIQFIGTVSWSLTFLIFGLRYTDRQFFRPKLTFTLLGLPGI